MMTSRIWRISRKRHRRVDAEQELQHGEADERHGGARGADRHGDEPVGGVAQLAQAPGAVAGDEQHERGDAKGLEQHGVHEQAEAEAEGRARHRAAEQADGGDEQRREVRRDAEHEHLGHRRDLEDAADEPDRRDAGHRPAPTRSRVLAAPPPTR